METFEDLENFPSFPVCPTVAVGTFDGVHLGHQAILEEVKRRAVDSNAPSAVLTFSPHPRSLLSPPQPLLSSIEERIELISRHGLDYLLILRFDQNLASTEPEDFVVEVLHERLGVSQVVVGMSHGFGRGRRGDPFLLRSLGKELGFDVEVLEPVLVGGIPVSSGKIREVLRRGEVELARDMLGRHYAIWGTVSPGERRGRSLEYPTANLKVTTPGKLIPGRGVYAVSVKVQEDEHSGLMNIGVRPTYGEGPSSLEVHLLDFDRELYGEPLKVYFVQRLRDELRFATEKELTAQIGRDEEEARRILKELRLTGSQDTGGDSVQSLK